MGINVERKAGAAVAQSVDQHLTTRYCAHSEVPRSTVLASRSASSHTREKPVTTCSVFGPVACHSLLGLGCVGELFQLGSRGGFGPELLEPVVDSF